MDSPILESMPLEILTMIISKGDFNDLCNLRLVSRFINSIVPAGIRKGDFNVKDVDWSSRAELQQFVQQVSRGWSGCLMANLVIFEIVGGNDIDPAMHTTENEAIALLSQAFTRIRQSSPIGILQSIQIQVERAVESDTESDDEDSDEGQAIVPEPGFDVPGNAPVVLSNEMLRYYAAARRTFNICSRALQASRLRCRYFHIVEGPNESGVPFNQLRRWIDFENPQPFLSSLEALSLCVGSKNPALSDDLWTTHVDPDYATLGEDDIPRVVIPDFIEMCPNIRYLHLTWAPYGPQNVTQPIPDFHILRSLKDVDLIKNLRVCRLWSLRTSCLDLYDFLVRLENIDTFELRRILAYGDEGYESIFQYLLSGQSRSLRNVAMLDMYCDGEPELGIPDFIREYYRRFPRDRHIAP